MARYRIVPNRSHVWIEARSNVHPIHTEANGLEGWLDLDVTNGKLNIDQLLLGHLEFPVANLKSGNGLEDRELQRRIDARKYPTIAGDLKVMKQTNEPTRYVVGGDLTFRGVTQTYEDDMTVDVLNDRTITLTGEATFDIRDFGMDPPRILLLKVRPEVDVRVEILAEKES